MPRYLRASVSEDEIDALTKCDIGVVFTSSERNDAWADIVPHSLIHHGNFPQAADRMAARQRALRAILPPREQNKADSFIILDGVNAKDAGVSVEELSALGVMVVACTAESLSGRILTSRVVWDYARLAATPRVRHDFRMMESSPPLLGTPMQLPAKIEL